MKTLERIPAEHRKQQPGLVWLLLIPFFNFVWIFFVYPKIAESFQSYFAAQGRTDVGDCGANLALIYCIITVCSVGCILLFIIPFIGPCFAMVVGITRLVLLILVLVKFNELRNKIPLSPAAPTA